MKIPGPMIAVLLIIAILFCCTSGLGFSGALNLIDYNSAQDLMGGDLFSFLRPPVSLDQISAGSPCNLITVADSEGSIKLAGIALSGSGSCAIGISAADADVRTLPLQFAVGTVTVSYTPVKDDEDGALKVNRDVKDEDDKRSLNLAVSRSGGSLVLSCSSACRLTVAN